MAIQNSIQNMYLWVYLFETQKRAGAVCSVDKALGWLLSGQGHTRMKPGGWVLSTHTNGCTSVVAHL